MVTVLLLRALRHTSYWADSGLAVPESDTEPLAPHEVGVGAVLQQLLHIQRVHTREVLGVESKTGGAQLATEEVGSGVYPCLALFPHSCRPNTVRVWLGGKAVLVAAGDIRQGERITDCWADHYNHTPAPQRRQTLGQTRQLDCRLIGWVVGSWVGGWVHVSPTTYM